MKSLFLINNENSENSSDPSITSCRPTAYRGVVLAKSLGASPPLPFPSPLLHPFAVFNLTSHIVLDSIVTEVLNLIDS